MAHPAYHREEKGHRTVILSWVCTLANNWYLTGNGVIINLIRYFQSSYNCRPLVHNHVKTIYTNLLEVTPIKFYSSCGVCLDFGQSEQPVLQTVLLMCLIHGYLGSDIVAFIHDFHAHVQTWSMHHAFSAKIVRPPTMPGHG